MGCPVESKSKHHRFCLLTLLEESEGPQIGSIFIFVLQDITELTIMPTQQISATGQTADRQEWRSGSGLPMSPRLIKGTVHMWGHPGMVRTTRIDGISTIVNKFIQLFAKGHHVLKVRFLFTKFIQCNITVFIDCGYSLEQK